jgi:hypothetical protein
MKKALLFFGLLASTAYAQDCSKIFISEYVEGWSTNKALEIYNPTNQTINLSEYFVARYSNGSASATVQNAVQLSGTIAPYDVFVAVLEKLDPAGTGQEAPIWDSLQARADGYFSPDYNVSNAFYWNGDDAIMLAKGTLPGGPTQNVTEATGFQIVDIFGKIGEDPGTAWTSTAPYNTGLGVELTVDHSLIRKPTVLKGVTAPVATFNALAEYDSIPAVTYLVDSNGDTIESQNGNPILFGNWFSLGTHDCGCNPLSVENPGIEEALVVYPNPTADGVVYIKGAAAIREVQVINALGQVISRHSNTSAAQLTVRIGGDRGVYIVRMVNDSGAVISKRVVVK